ncbi:hypothetical protein D3C76_1150800 [compost metagenome]
MHGDRSLLVHARAVVTGVPLDIHGYRFVDANGEVVSTVGMGHDPLALLKIFNLIVQRLVEVAHGGSGKIDNFHVRAP